MGKEDGSSVAGAEGSAFGATEVQHSAGGAAALVGENMLDLPGADSAPVSAPMGVAMIALNMAFKWHDLGVVKDGAMYQQLKLEGRNIPILHLDMVFETAKRIERHLLVSSQEIAELMVSGVIDALEAAAEEEPDSSEEPSISPSEASAGTPATDDQKDGPGAPHNTHPTKAESHD